MYITHNPTFELTQTRAAKDAAVQQIRSNSAIPSAATADEFMGDLAL